VLAAWVPSARLVPSANVDVVELDIGTDFTALAGQVEARLAIVNSLTTLQASVTPTPTSCRAS
jgi:hypothetical protein